MINDSNALLTNILITNYNYNVIADDEQQHEEFYNVQSKTMYQWRTQNDLLTKIKQKTKTKKQKTFKPVVQCIIENNSQTE